MNPGWATPRPHHIIAPSQRALISPPPPLPSTLSGLHSSLPTCPVFPNAARRCYIVCGPDLEQEPSRPTREKKSRAPTAACKHAAEHPGMYQIIARKHFAWQLHFIRGLDLGERIQSMDVAFSAKVTTFCP
jgi:hypothetical protein